MSRDTEHCTCLVGATQHAIVCPLAGLEWRQTVAKRAKDAFDLASEGQHGPSAFRLSAYAANHIPELLARLALLEGVLAAARDVSAHDVDSVQVLREALRLCDATTGEVPHE